METLSKNIFDAFETGEIQILAHCANCQCTMGAGIAKEIKQRYNEAYEADLATGRTGDKLGTLSFAKIGKQYIVNLYAQENFGREKRQINYEALATSLDKLCNGKDKSLVIGFPFKLGCVNAGGNWQIVKTIIEETMKQYGREGNFYKI